MTVMNQFERVMMFIDGSNVFRSIQNFNHETGKNFRIDYLKLRDYLCNGRDFIRPYYYGSEDAESGPAYQGFLYKLKTAGFEVVSKPLRVYINPDGGEEKWEKGIDIALATDFISLAWENGFDTAIIVSGDSDYIEAIKRVKQKGKRVEVVSFRNSMGNEMRTVGDKTTFLDDIVDKISL